MKLIRRRGTRSSVALFSIATLALAMTGLLYAHWTDTLSATVGIQTGTFGAAWGVAGTDDDGIPTNDFAIVADDNITAPQLFDRWLDLSSADPAAPDAATRYDKDVARCAIQDDPLNPELLWVNTVNAYPSYHCTIYTSVTNEETVPIKASFFRLVIWAGPAGQEGPVDPDRIVPLAEGKVGLLNETLTDYEVILDITDGIRCGTQIDPGETVPVKGWFHVEQGAEQLANYGFYIHQDFMNWNEWTPDFCSPGAVLAGP